MSSKGDREKWRSLMVSERSGKEKDLGSWWRWHVDWHLGNCSEAQANHIFLVGMSVNVTQKQAPGAGEGIGRGWAWQSEEVQRQVRYKQDACLIGFYFQFSFFLHVSITMKTSVKRGSPAPCRDRAAFLRAEFVLISFLMSLNGLII